MDGWTASTPCSRNTNPRGDVALATKLWVEIPNKAFYLTYPVVSHRGLKLPCLLDSLGYVSPYARR